MLAQVSESNAKCASNFISNFVSWDPIYFLLIDFCMPPFIEFFFCEAFIALYLLCFHFLFIEILVPYYNYSMFYVIWWARVTSFTPVFDGTIENRFMPTFFFFFDFSKTTSS